MYRYFSSCFGCWHDNIYEHFSDYIVDWFVWSMDAYLYLKSWLYCYELNCLAANDSPLTSWFCAYIYVLKHHNFILLFLAHSNVSATIVFYFLAPSNVSAPIVFYFLAPSNVSATIVFYFLVPLMFLAPIVFYFLAPSNNVFSAHRILFSGSFKQCF